MTDLAERRGATTVELSGDQLALLQSIYNEFRAESAWPTMYRVDRAFIKMKRRGTPNTAAVMRDLPPGLLMRSGIRHDPAMQDQIMLTISGVARCAGTEDDVETFLRAVRWCAGHEQKREPVQGETSIQVDRRQVMRAVPRSIRRDAGSMDRLFLLLCLHHWGSVGNGRPTDGTNWTLRLGPDVRRFRKVTSVEDFIDRRMAWCEEEEQWLLPPSQADDTPAAEPPTPRAYLNPRVLDQLRETAGSAWDITKLLTLTEELDACVQASLVYASHSLLRAILDHIPPLFGQKSFAAVVSNHSWGQTDRRYLKKLNAFRDQADDALHRQITKMPDLLMLDDLPPGAAVNALLRGCVEQLQKP